MSVETFLTENFSLLQAHLGIFGTLAVAIVGTTWNVSRAFQSREIKIAEGLRDHYKARLDDAQKRLQEMTPQSQAKDLDGLINDSRRRFIAVARADVALRPNRLVHVVRNAQGDWVVHLADKLLRREAHGFVTSFFDRGEEVQVERQGQFKLSFVPTEHTIFLGTDGEPEEYHEMISGSIVQSIGTLGPDNVCLFNPGVKILAG